MNGSTSLPTNNTIILNTLNLASNNSGSSKDKDDDDIKASISAIGSHTHLLRNQTSINFVPGNVYYFAMVVKVLKTCTFPLPIGHASIRVTATRII